MEHLPKRKNPRLKNYDYSQAGYYFVTICAKDKLNLFGEIVGSDDPVRPHILTYTPTMQANEVGKVIQECWNKIDEIYANVRTDAFCLMPNHIHGIVAISERDSQSRPSLPKIIQGFKSITTRICFKYDYKAIWQKSFHDHIIRDENDYKRIHEYINTNALKWKEDNYYVH